MESHTELLKWPTNEELSQICLSISPSMSVKRINKAETNATIDRLKTWYPAIQIGAESKHLDEHFFRNSCDLENCDGSARYLPLSVISDSGEVIGFISFAIDRLAKTLTSPLGIVNPVYRGKGVAYFGPNLLEAMGKALGLSLVYYFVTLETVAQQKVAEALGFKICGILPSWDEDFIDGKSLRVYEAIYAKPILKVDEIRLPLQENLTEKTASLFRFLFQS